MAPYLGPEFPRLKWRGLIEASCPILDRPAANMFPRLKWRGLIEASFGGVLVFMALAFPRLKWRGLIEATRTIGVRPLR